MGKPVDVLKALAAAALALAWATISAAIAIAGQRETICVTDPQGALERAERFHEFGTKELMAARGLPWSGIALRDLGPRAEGYLRRRPGGSLILYVLDDEDACAFLWEHGRAQGDRPLYARIAGGAAKLGLSGQALRDLITAGALASGRSPSRQAVSAEPEDIAEPKKNFDELASEIAAVLFPAEFHAALKRTSSLSIIPVGSISTLPLAAIPPFGDGHPSIEFFSVSILTLAEDIDTKLFGWVPAFHAPVIIGNPDARIEGWNLPPLPGAEAEARTAHAIFGGTLRIGKDARSESYAADVKSAELIVIAAHGVSDTEDPINGSFLALSDGAFTPSDIMTTPLRGRPLVVLSACQSGLGRALDAGVIGLARAFQIAGATNTVMSLWNVDDAATQYQMTQFYRNLQSMTPHEALRRSALEARKTYPNPMKWSAFQLFGVSTVLTRP